MADDPAALITPGAIWQPGAWTPSRCALWHKSDEPTRKRLEEWVMAESKRNRCNPTQLPRREAA